MRITVVAEHEGEETTHAIDIPAYTGFLEELEILARSVSIDGKRPTLARLLATMILPGVNVAIKTYADKRYKQRVAELRDYLN